ncbi:sensor histidine kinase [Halalkalibacter urbisdiaboli]|uniref:sensor histidine kinase n=1 Tax=Halalkalibacter urbisdiaboli TaxID=1960589 RepID=UPI000B44F3FF|nr:HAMP domain-containing sensor histidine kinase [Halalkalibacter urbisdiaboli]
MNLNRISIKLGVTIISLLLVVLLPLGFVINQIVSSFYYGEVKNEIDTLSTRYASALSGSQNAMMTSMIEMMADFSGQHLYIVDKTGEVIGNANVPGLPLGSTIPDEEQALLSNGSTIGGEYEHAISGQRFLVSGTPIYKGNSFLGSVFVLSSVENIDESLYRLRQMIILSGVGAFFLALGVTIVLSRTLSDPLVQMEHATRKIARGNLETKVAIKTKDETGSLAQAINDLATDLKRYRDTRREFFANISHELRTPITYLEGYANVLKKELYQTEEEKEKYLDIIEAEAKHLTRLIEDLFELSKLEEGKITLQEELIDIDEIIENVENRVALKATEKGLTLDIQRLEGTPFLYGDGLRMEQIIYNLLNNAIKYTDKGSIKVSVNTTSHDVVITIEDTGKGMPKEDLPYIFERFYRIEKSRSREHGGTGLGLAIVKQLVELQGGKIQVSSDLGAGTRFELMFPLMKEG